MQESGAEFKPGCVPPACQGTAHLSSRLRKKRVLPGSPCRPDRPRSWLSIRRDSCASERTCECADLLACKQPLCTVAKASACNCVAQRLTKFASSKSLRHPENTARGARCRRHAGHPAARRPPSRCPSPPCTPPPASAATHQAHTCQRMTLCHARFCQQPQACSP